jgi:hypothetical protein
MVIVELIPTYGRGTQIGYALQITTAYANGDPFPDRIDQNFTEPDTGFFQVANTGGSTFSGTIGTIAVSSFAGDLSWLSGTVTLAPGASVSVAIPDDSSAVGGFNGPYYFYRPGIEITLQGTVATAAGSESVNLLAADRDIQSGVFATDPFGLVTDSFVLQGGDPWGFNNGDAFALAQAYGAYTFSQPAPEPASALLLAAGLAGCLAAGSRSSQRIPGPCRQADSRQARPPSSGARDRSDGRS